MIKQAILRGIKIVIPVLVTFLILYWALYTVESVFKAILLPFIPQRYYFPGLGAIIGLIIIFLIGITINAWMINWIYKGVDAILNKIPIVKTVYQATQDFMGIIDAEVQSLGYPVYIDYQGMKILGLVTRKTFEDLHCSSFAEGEIAVYLPMSYQIGGFTVIVPSSLVTPLDMDVQDAMKFILTAGITKKKT